MEDSNKDSTKYRRRLERRILIYKKSNNTIIEKMFDKFLYNEIFYDGWGIYNISISNTISINENNIKESVLKKNDSFDIEETSTSKIEFIKNFIENLYLVDFLSKNVNIPISDSLFLTEIISYVTGRQEDISDSFSLTETDVKGIGKKIEENILLYETKTLLLSYIKTFSDNIVLIENIIKEQSLNKDESFSLLENISKNVNIKKQSSFVIIDEIINSYILNKIENISFSEYLNKENTKRLIDTISIEDLIFSIKEYNRVLTDNVSISEEKKVDNIKNIFDDFSFQDSIFVEMLYAVLLSDNMQLSETLNKDKKINKTEILNIFESISKAIYLKKNDYLTLLDNIIFIYGLKKTESVVLSDSFRKEVIKQNIENVLISDLILTTEEYHKFFDEYLIVHENIKLENTKTLHDLMLIAETIKKGIEIPKNETIIITENITKTPEKNINTSLSINESISKNYEINIIGDISLVDTISKLSDFNLSESEILELEASISFLQTEPFTSRKTVLITSKNKTILLTK